MFAKGPSNRWNMAAFLPPPFEQIRIPAIGLYSGNSNVPLVDYKISKNMSQLF